MFNLVPLGFFVIFIFSLGARSLKSFSRHKLERFCRRRGAEERLAVILKQHEDVGVAVSLARLLCISLFLVGFFFYEKIPPAPPESLHQESALVVSVFFAVIIFCVVLADFWLPRAFVKLWGTPIVYFGWFLWSTTKTLLYPLLLVDRIITLVYCRLAGYTEDEDAFEEEIRTIVTEGHREGRLEEDAREMIEGVIELQEVVVSEIMTPRTDMRCISDALSWEEMLQIVTSSTHSRIPVYKETRDDIVGVIHTKNLLREVALNNPEQRRPWTELMSEPLFIPETKPVDTLLQEFQNARPKGSDSDDRAKGHLAIVLDEYGGVAGIVTLEDILEEIVGEITDEHDAIVTDESITEVNPDVFDVLGRVRIDDLNEQLNLHLPEEEDYDTVAGFIFSTLGHVPDEGESVDFEHDGQTVRLTVVAVTRRRIERVRVERMR
ncbi:MAG: hemolysin family protein [Planctomycetaceae bacterium]|nr:hemolysin family protein [Planctomycetaceae bacterium]